MRALLLLSIGLDCGKPDLPRDLPEPKAVEDSDLAVDLTTFPDAGLVVPGHFCVGPTVTLSGVPIAVPGGPDAVRLPREAVLDVLTRVAPTWRRECEVSRELRLEVHCADSLTMRALLVGIAGRAAVTVGPVGDDVSPLAVAHALLPGDPETPNGHALVDLEPAPFHTLVREDGLRELAWWPAGGFAAGRTYDVILQGGGLGLRMADLRCLDEPHRWSVTTRTEPAFRARWTEFEGESWLEWDDLGLATYTVTAGTDELAHDTRETALPVPRDRCVHVTAHLSRDTEFDVDTEVCP